MGTRPRTTFLTLSDPAVAFPFSVASPPALTPPAPLSPRERGEKDRRELLFYPSSPSGRGGAGEVRAGGAETRKMKATAGSDTTLKPCLAAPTSPGRPGSGPARIGCPS